MNKQHIQNNVRILRLLNGEMTQQALAEKVGVTRQTILGLEKGRYSPSLELAFRIAEVFKEPLEKVFSYNPTGDRPKPPYDWQMHNDTFLD